MITDLFNGQPALASIRAFEEARFALSKLDDADKPDKHTTVFVDCRDLVWAWFAESGPGGFVDFADRIVAECGDVEMQRQWNADRAGILARYIEGFDAVDPPQVAVLEVDGGLRH
ncbi:hypothetical protein CMUST_12630 [Corynebacterium mustelae]|uniref:Uncharacterized protein n=1 Tax=Corynebacterium mustelae TaxID=571915 RepID=A0A0G3H0A0_9CORY|nr:hypothetical protein [Corynebacterium mustelae]AKK06831.1 hypothetical protein CMUST_12630 [Corynebacterium mustelae]